MIKSIALILICGVVVRSTSTRDQNADQNGYEAETGQQTQGIKAKKIQIVYIKVPLSKVLQNANSGYNNGANSGERGYSEGGGGGRGPPGEGRYPNYAGDGYRGGFGESYGASNQNNYGGQGIIYDNEETSNGKFGGGFASGGGSDLNYQNDANLGMAYGAAVGNALPQTQNFEESANYGQESQNSGYAQTNQIGFGQNEGYGQMAQNGGYHQNQQNNGYGPNGQNNNGGYGQENGFGENYEKGKLRKGNQHYPKMMANFMQPIPIMATMHSFGPMKGFSSPSFSTNFPSFGGKGFGTTSFNSIGGLSGISGTSGIGGITGFGGIKNKLSMLLGNKFGMGGGGGLLGGMMGWND